MRFLHARARSFGYAFAGWRHVLRTQHNAWIHAVISLAVIALAAWLRVPWRDWAVIFLTMGMVWMAEFANTALEAVVDLASGGKEHELARISKDVAAAAVLIAALTAALVGLLLLGPPLVQRISAGWEG
ncbi:MAG: diacylglycerol kinase family protein [Chloroflexi bacterium]|nr:diacylglycerol kinase family protein [Chloroflexota bacterium]